MANNLTNPPLLLKLIAHDLRWHIVQILAASDMRVQELSQALNQPQNLVSYHLNKLHQAELVLEHKSISDAREIYYGLDFKKIDDRIGALGKLLHPAFSASEFDVRKLNSVWVLFVCTHNSARSQMAEGLLRERSRSELQVFSAGTEPTSVHPFAIRVMADQGIDISQSVSKGLENFQNRTFDYVITVCDRARETCPIFPGNPVHIHWSISDPTEVEGSDEVKYIVFKGVADQLANRIKYLLQRILSKKN